MCDFGSFAGKYGTPRLQILQQGKRKNQADLTNSVTQSAANTEKHIELKGKNVK